MKRHWIIQIIKKNTGKEKMVYALLHPIQHPVNGHLVKDLHPGMTQILFDTPDLPYVATGEPHQRIL